MLFGAQSAPFFIFPYYYDISVKIAHLQIFLPHNQLWHHSQIS